MTRAPQAGERAEVADRDEGFPPESRVRDQGAAARGVAIEALDQVADDRVAHVGANDAIEKAKREPRLAMRGAGHDASSPTSRPAAMRRSATRFCRSARFPTAVTE